MSDDAELIQKGEAELTPDVVRKVRAKMEKLYPKAVFLEGDYGFSLDVQHPEKPSGFRLTYVFRPERDGATGYFITTDSRLEEIASKFNEM